ncbi:MAG: type II secretion system GspH family protein, partial [Candidatus Accumulibacter sp.]|nr:type II secretion system GspH family protein [Accumulibacter sp.]
MTNSYTFKSRARGFSLAELTIVLVIVALLMGGMLMPITAQMNQRDFRETERQLDELREALTGYAIVNGRLPRPAASLTDGRERPNDCANDAECTGFIPWAALGVKKTDAWNKLIRYSVTPSYAKNNVRIVPTDYASKKIKTRDANGALQYVMGDDDHTCTSGTDGRVYRCSPAVLLS